MQYIPPCVWPPFAYTWLHSLHILTDYQMIDFTRTLMAIENRSCVESFSIVAELDDLIEADEQFRISLTTTSFIVTISNSSLLVTIENNNCKCNAHKEHQIMACRF